MTFQDRQLVMKAFDSQFDELLATEIEKINELMKVNFEC